MKNLLKSFEPLLKALGLVIVIILITVFPAMWLWNWLMPTIFGLKEITFWQTIGLQILLHILLPKSYSSKQ